MKKISLYAGLLLFLFSCSEEHVGQFATDGNAPSPLSNVKVENLPGGAKISYDLPAETDISYVRAEYEYKGKAHVVRSSIYSNFLTVEGLGTVTPLDVKLYTVDHSENSSQPVSVSVTPGVPPVKSIFESMKMLTAFGGVNLTWKNATGTEVGITAVSKDEEGKWKEGETLYTALKDGDYTFRGYDNQERDFGFYLVDKWGNASDTAFGKFKPIYEILLDKSKHKRLVLPLDNNTQYNATTWAFDKMFDGITDKDQGWHAKDNSQEELPLYFTVDLGVEAKLSRFKLWHRPGTYYYSHNNIKEFEVWGATNYKQAQTEEYWQDGGEWQKDWEYLGSFETIKPSGPGAVTNDDKEFAAKGFEFNIPLEAKNIRYLRFAMRSNWSGGKIVHIAELSFYGNDGKDEEDKDNSNH